MDLPRPTLSAPVPAALAPHPGAEAVQVAPPAAGVALLCDRHGIEQFAVTAGAALHPEPVALAGEVGDQLKASASHASTMPGARSVGNRLPEQSVNRPVDCGGRRRLGTGARE